VQQAKDPDTAFISSEIIIIIVLVVILIGGIVFFLQRRRQQQAEAVPTTEVEADMRDTQEKVDGNE
jgi:preprotein translocase subunit YajC